MKLTTKKLKELSLADAKKVAGCVSTGTSGPASEEPK